MESNRFEEIHTQGRNDISKVLRDNETGVLYLYHRTGPAAGLTVMVDASGRPLVDKE